MKNSKKTPIKSSAPVQIRNDYFSGPIPPPSILADYERLKVGFAERIISMAERQSEHRQSLERSKAEDDSFVSRENARHNKSRDLEAKIGQIFALIFSLFTVGGGLYVILQGHDWAGVSIVGSSLATIATALIYGRKKDNK